MTSFVSAEQVVDMWINTHSIKLTGVQRDKLLLVAGIIADGAYAVGKRDAIKELAKIKPTSDKTDQERYDSVSVTGSGRQVNEEKPDGSS